MKTARVRTACGWAQEGTRIHRLRPGEIIDDRDPRFDARFWEVAQREGWIEVVAEAKPSPRGAQQSPGKARASPAKPREAPQRKDAPKPKGDEEP